ncbi:hypothetical protein BJV74DRAFT_79259 [Russula compacta]|nr:hypothetical protein BJV74DRAFT_79259 [Russula compacta]
MADRSTTGMPLLSGPAPYPHSSARADISCRKCNKEFNIVFTRARKCNHCGFSYCSSCSDYQALMPREGPSAGFDPVPVCAFCIENLTITAGGRGYLRNLSLARLKKYVDAYNIGAAGVLEKDDLIERIIAIRENGCLPYANESFYRKHSVPNGRTGRPRGLFSRRDEAQPVQPTAPAQSPNYTSSNFPRPDLDPSRQQRSSPGPRRATPHPPAPPQSQSTPRTHPHPPQRSTPPMASSGPQHTTSGDAPYQQPRTSTAHTPGPGTTPGNGNSSNSAPRPPSTAPPPPAIPSLDELLAMTDNEISQMSISALKTVLFQNHVNARLLLEKGDLVARVCALLGDERQERAREAAIRAREEEENIARQYAMMDEQRHREEQARQDQEQLRKNNSTHSPEDGAELPPPPTMRTSADLERNGLCVVCQDEEANIAIVDCGHLAMCRHCSDLIMSSSRECPLCRTRIVTEARLLRIFKS